MTLRRICRMSLTGLTNLMKFSSASTSGGLSGASLSPSPSSPSQSTTRPPAVTVREIAVTHAHDHGQERYASQSSLSCERRSVDVDAPMAEFVSLSPPSGMSLIQPERCTRDAGTLPAWVATVLPASVTVSATY